MCLGDFRITSQVSLVTPDLISKELTNLTTLDWIHFKTQSQYRTAPGLKVRTSIVK